LKTVPRAGFEPATVSEKTATVGYKQGYSTFLIISTEHETIFIISLSVPRGKQYTRINGKKNSCSMPF